MATGNYFTDDYEQKKRFTRRFNDNDIKSALVNSLCFLGCCCKEGMIIFLVVVGVHWSRSLMVVGQTDDKSSIFIGRAKYLILQIIFTFEVKILATICIQIGNICTFIYLYVIFGGLKMTFCQYHIQIFRIFNA
jgi:hypothetical protein